MSTNILDTWETQMILEKLEHLEDDLLGVELLKEFNSATKKLGQLLLNLDNSLDHQEWKKSCDDAKVRVDRIILKIKSL